MIKIKNTLDVLEGVQVEINKNKIKVTGSLGSLEREFAHPDIKIVKKENKLVFEVAASTKKQKTMVNTFKAHLNSMMVGVTEGYTYKLKVCSGHFPMTVAIEGDKLTIKNFLGEKSPRHAKIIAGVKAEIKGNDIILTGSNKEEVGQTAANFERSTRIVNRDRRRFQDGIYLTEKPGKEIK